ncbi:MAG: hypothetical protein EBQ68_07340 [Betaproteobacteria bacterium]|nr:hypothetical protein [Betaproteobacteria bacterium]
MQPAVRKAAMITCNLWGLIRACVVCLSLIAPGLSQATDCPHYADFVLYKEKINGKVLLKKGSYVYIDGAMPITIWTKWASPGDSCILTFERWGYSRDIGGGLTLVWGQANYLAKSSGYSNYWPDPSYTQGIQTYCGTIYSNTSAYDYRWGGRISATAVGYETFVCPAGDTISVPFYITGVYDGTLLQLKPQSGAEYRIATGESSSRFNPYNPFPANGSGQAPLVIKSSDPGCATSSQSTTVQPLHHLFLQEQISANLRHDLYSANLHQLHVLRRGYRVLLAPTWLGQPDHQRSTLPKLQRNRPLEADQQRQDRWQHLARHLQFYLYHLPARATENIQAVITRRLNAWNFLGQSCSAQINFSTGPVGGGQIDVSKMTNCDNMQVSTEVRFVQTAALVNPITSSPDPNNLTALYAFTANNLGLFEVDFKRPTWEPKRVSFFANPNGVNLVAPFVQGCNVQETSYPTAPPDFITALDMLVASSVQVLSTFSSVTTMRQCNLVPSDVITVAPLALNPANAGTTRPFLWLSTSPSGNQTLIDDYQLVCTKCKPIGGKTAPPDNLVFRATRTVRAWSTSNNPLCKPSYSNQNKSMVISNAAYCDSHSVETKVEVIQKGMMLNAEPYTFVSPLASHTVSVPMIGTVSTTQQPITNKAFALRPALGGRVCRVVLSSSPQKK